jgi:hypothetical protein
MERERSRLAWSFVVALAVMVVSAGRAEAQYLDPGAGSLIVQAVIAVTIGAAAAIRLYWRRITGFFSQRRQRDDSRG